MQFQNLKPTAFFSRFYTKTPYCAAMAVHWQCQVAVCGSIRVDCHVTLREECGVAML